MKIAFVGKGGSGKSTLAALFIRYLQLRNKNVLAIDADINMNLAGLLGGNVSDESLLARPEVAETIRHYLKGTNSRIQDTTKFLPTTPPGKGSNLIFTVNDPILVPYAACISNEPIVNLLTVGTYDREGIGQTCYHSHLFAAENLLSHIVTNQDFYVVCDMVAGTDAFAYSMHLQFDAIILIVEPTPESIEVCTQYLSLARESGINSLVHLVANKIDGDDDLNFVHEYMAKEPLGVVPFIPELKKIRQQGQILGENILKRSFVEIMDLIQETGYKPALSSADRLSMIYKLHEKLNAKKWVELGYGNVMDQIDPDFLVHQKVGVTA